MKRLSVVIAGYNTPECMWMRCVKSVLLACGPDDEVICVDDGSQVGFRLVDYDLFNELRNDSRLAVLSFAENRGLPTGRNEGIKIARGHYITFVDSDDEVNVETFDRCIHALETSGNDIAIYGVDVIWINDGLEKKDHLPDANLGKFTAESIVKVYEACLFDYACNKVYRRSFFDAHNLRFEENVRTGEDTVFNCSCVVAGATWSVVDYVGYVYYRYDGSMLSRYVPNMRETHRRKLEARKACRAACPGTDALLGGEIVISDAVLDRMEWQNMWRQGSKISLTERFKFFKRHITILGGYSGFARMLLMTFLRRNCYIRAVRRRHIKRLFPNVIDRGCKR